MPRDSIGHTFKVAVLLCLVCSLAVSLAAVGLRARQQENRERERRKNILLAAGLYDEQKHRNRDIEDLFAQVETRIIDLDSGEYNDDLDPETFDQVKAAKNRATSKSLLRDEDPAVLKRREHNSLVYLVKKGSRIDQLVLPIRGYGLWSTLWGFISLDAASLREGPEHVVIRGLTFYKHGETPGLGGEVDSQSWKNKWNGVDGRTKKAFDQNWNVLIEVSKRAQTDYQVEALSGATITSQGVTNMLKYWLGKEGFGPFLEKLKTDLQAKNGNGIPVGTMRKSGRMKEEARISSFLLPPSSFPPPSSPNGSDDG